MYRIAEFEEGTDVFKRIAGIVSDTMIQEIDDYLIHIDEIAQFYVDEFAGDPIGPRDIGFFSGVLDYISPSIIRAPILNLSKEGGCWETEDFSVEDMIGMEIIMRKLERMKEKLEDPNECYTFDLLEEYLLWVLIEVEKDLPFRDEVNQDEINKLCNILLLEGLEYEDAAGIAKSAYQFWMMGPDDSDLVFWDDDFSIVFADSFVDGFQILKSGTGGLLGYSYDDACIIFSDIGIDPPISLLGSRDAFGIRTEEMRNKAMEEWDKDFLSFAYTDDMPDISDEQLPFS